MGNVRFSNKQKGYTGRTGLMMATEIEPGNNRIWIALRAMSPVGVCALAEAARMSASATIYYLNTLEQAGYVWRAPGNIRPYQLLVNHGEQAPARLRGGKSLYDPNTNEEIKLRSKRIWPPRKPADESSLDHQLMQAMVMLRDFTASDVAPLIKHKTSAVSRKLKILHRFDYIRCNGKSGGEAWYHLPYHRIEGKRLAPAVSLKLGKLYDYNTKEVIDIKTKGRAS